MKFRPSEISIHLSVLKYFNKLLDSEKQMASAAKQMLSLTADLSSFDVNMSHSSYNLIDFSSEMSTLSESNLAIVQQTTASMNQVNESVSSTSDTLTAVRSIGVLIEGTIQSCPHKVNELKNNVMNDANIMSTQIQQLVEMANRVNDIVNDVKAIADQTNLWHLMHLLKRQEPVSTEILGCRKSENLQMTQRIARKG